MQKRPIGWACCLKASSRAGGMETGMAVLAIKLCSLVGVQRAFAVERVGALLEDRHIREQDEAAHRQLLQQQLEQTRQQLTACQKTLQTTTRDFILGMYAVAGCHVDY